jgi:integrase
LSGFVSAISGSGNFETLEENTRRRKRAILGDICNIAGASGQRLGLAPYASLKKVHVRKIRDLKADVPEAANHRLKQISALYAWAIKNDLATVNPAEKVEKLRGRSEGFYTWSEDDVETFETYWPVGSRPRLAMSIMLYLGVRRSDAIVIGKKHESRDGSFVSFVQFKGRKKSGKLLTLPVLPVLRTILDTSELGGETWLETAFGKRYTNAGFGNAFKDWCVEANLPRCTSHGLRKAGAVRAAEAGASMSLWRCSGGRMPTWRGFTRVRRRKNGWRKAAPRSCCKRVNCPTLCPTLENVMKKQLLKGRMEATLGFEPRSSDMHSDA